MPDGELLYGPSFSALWSRAFDLAAAHAGEHPGSVVLLEDNDAVQEAAVERWSELPKRNRLQLRVGTLDDVVEEVHSTHLGAAPQVGTLARQRVIETVLQEYEGLDRARRFTDGFSELLRELEASGAVTTGAIETRLSASDLPEKPAKDIATIFGRYRERLPDLAHPEAITRSEQYLAVSETDQELSEGLDSVDHVIVSGHVDPSAVELAVLERIVAEFPTTVIFPALAHEAGGTEKEPFRPMGTDEALATPFTAFEELGLAPEYVPTDNPTRPSTISRRLYRPTESTIDASATVSWHEAPTPDREVRHLARRLRSTLAAGTDPAEILVVAPGLLSYRDRIADIFDEYAIPHVTSLSILLERTYAGRAIMDTVGLCIDPTADQLARLATNPTASLPVIGTDALVELIDRLPTNTIESLRRHADASLLDDLEPLLERTESVRTGTGVDTLAAVGGLLDALAISSNVEALESDHRGGPGADGQDQPEDPTIVSGYEQRAVRRVREVLESLMPVLHAGVDDPLDEIEQALQGVRVPPPRRHPAGRIRVAGLADTPMADFSSVYVLGATQRDFGQPGDRPRYFQRAFEALELEAPERERDLHRYRFAMLLANAETIHFTTPKETMAGEDVLSSPLLDEVTRVADIEETTGVAKEARGSREDIQRALAGRTPEDLESPLETLSAEELFDDQTAASIRAGAQTGANRADPGPSPHDGKLEPATLAGLGEDLRRTPYSPSRLNTYAKCGFKYYVAKGLEIDAPDELSNDIGRFAVGDVVHKTLEYFFEGLIEAAEGPVDLEAFDRSTLERRLLDAGRQAVEAVDDDFRSAFDRHQLRTLFAGLATPEENEFYQNAADGAAGTGLLVRILDRELGESGWQPHLVETWFGREGSPPVDPGGLPVYGIIDRLDISGDDPGSRSARVIDYKTYRRDAKDAVRGVDFQLPSYVLGAAAILGEADGQPPDSIDGAYRVVSPPNQVSHPASLGQRVESDLEADLAEFLEAVLPRWFHELRTALDAGAFQPAIVGADTAGCHHCDFASVCDVRHHRRFETIEAFDRLEHPAFVPPGSRPGDLADNVAISHEEAGE